MEAVLEPPRAGKREYRGLPCLVSSCLGSVTAYGFLQLWQRRSRRAKLAHLQHEHRGLRIECSLRYRGLHKKTPEELHEEYEARLAVTEATSEAVAGVLLFPA